MSHETPENCIKCKKLFSEPGSVIRTFYKKNTDIKIGIKGFYYPAPKDGLPAGTYCFNEDVEVDSDLPEEYDKCAYCGQTVQFN